MALFLAYLAIFGVGPVLFLALTRARPSRHRVTIGATSVAGLMIAAGLLQETGRGDGMLLAGLTCAWLGWIVTMATIVQAVRLRMGLPGIRQWSAALGAAATAAPWFGLSLAMGA